MTETRIITTERTIAGHEIAFIWYGGPYIDLCFSSDGPAFDVNDPERDHEHDLANFAA